ncbi:MAG: helix-hairpin-helix domain-containing protein [Flavobacteriales bacterium]
MTQAQQPFKEDVKDLMSLHAGERRGFLVMMLLLLVLSAGVIYAQWFYKPDPADLDPLREEMEVWLAARKVPETQPTLAEPFPFDPNAMERSDWLALGLSDKQVDGLERYMSKGGRFRVKNDLGRMYTIRPEQFERLKPFILLPDSLPRRSYEAHERKPYPRFAERGQQENWPPREERAAFHKVEVNSADTLALIALPGIGPSFARGIVKYRESLGGYASLDQLSEVYVLKDKPDAVLRLKELLVLDTLMVHRININTCTVEELATHPYCRWKIAKPLIAYRTQHGAFRTVDDIRGCVLIDEALLRKLAPYLTVE